MGKKWNSITPILMFQYYEGKRPGMYTLYTDKVTGATSGSRQDLEEFLNFRSTYYLGLECIFEISET